MNYADLFRVTLPETALEIAASVYGFPDDLVRSWNATSASMDSLGHAYNDLLLPMNELGMASPSVLSQGLYQMGDGRSRSRSTSSGELDVRPRYGCIMLSSGEAMARSSGIGTYIEGLLSEFARRRPAHLSLSLITNKDHPMEGDWPRRPVR